MDIKFLHLITFGFSVLPIHAGRGTPIVQERLYRPNLARGWVHQRDRQQHLMAFSFALVVTHLLGESIRLSFCLSCSRFPHAESLRRHCALRYGRYLLFRGLSLRSLAPLLGLC